MATIDSLQDSVNTLTSSTTTLLNEVTTSKTTLTNSKDLAETAATSATTKAGEAASSATTATSKATAAATSASQAATSAASASALVTGVATGMPNVRPSLNLDFVNSKVIDPRIDFTRSTTATYYDGKTTTKAEENLVDNSTSLGGSAAYVSFTTNNAVAPDGTTTAAKVTADGQQAVHYKYFSTTSVPLDTHNISLYFKAGTQQFVQMFLSGGSAKVNFDIINGTYDTGTFGSAVISASVEDVGSGWFRCSAKVNRSGGSIWIIPVTSITSAYYESNSLTTDFYVWGPQLENRNSLTAYTSTTGSPITNYIPMLQTAAINEARLDHDPATGETLGLLIEKSGTNLCSGSSTFAGGRVGDAYNQANAGIAPDGTQTARLFWNENGTGGYSYNTVSNVIGNGTFTLSVFVKQVTGSSSSGVRLQTGGAAGTFSVTFSDDNGAVGYGSGGLTNISSGSQEVGGGWHRMWITATTSSTAGYQEMQIDVTDGVSKWLAWGLQIEEKGTMSSYIPTSGSQGSRGADSLAIEFSDFDYNQSESCVYGEFKTSRDILSIQSYYIGSDDNAEARIAYSNASQAAMSTYGGGSYTVNYQGVIPSDSIMKLAYSVDMAGAESASSYGSNTTVTGITHEFRTKISAYFIGCSHSGGSMDGHVRGFRYYPKRLGSSEMSALVQD